MVAHIVEKRQAHKDMHVQAPGLELDEEYHDKVDVAQDQEVEGKDNATRNTLDDHDEDTMAMDQSLNIEYSGKKSLHVISEGIPPGEASPAARQSAPAPAAGSARHATQIFPPLSHPIATQHTPNSSLAVSAPCPAPATPSISEDLMEILPRVFALRCESQLVVQSGQKLLIERLLEMDESKKETAYCTRDVYYGTPEDLLNTCRSPLMHHSQALPAIVVCSRRSSACALQIPKAARIDALRASNTGHVACHPMMHCWKHSVSTLAAMMSLRAC